MKKIVKKTFLFLIVSVLFVSSVNADIDWNQNGLEIGEPNSTVDIPVYAIPDVAFSLEKIWNTAKLILQVVAIGTIIFAGVRYIIASAEQKADIKKSLGILAIGAAIVFAATYFVDFIQRIADQLL